MFDRDSTHVVCVDCDCHYEYDDLKESIEPHGEVFKVCPNCNGDEFIPAAECQECGEVVPCEDILQGLCVDCANAVRDSVRALLADAFHKTEWKKIGELMEGEELFPTKEPAEAVQPAPPVYKPPMFDMAEYSKRLVEAFARSASYG